MATLTPLTVGNANTPSGWDSAPNGNLGDDSDGTYGFVSTNSDGTYDQGWVLGDVDTDFGTMLTLFCVIRYGWSASPANSVWAEAGTTLRGLQCRIMNGATVLAANDNSGTFETIVDNPTATSPTNSSSIQFNYVDTSANKATWDAGIVEVRIQRDRLMGGSSEEQRVYEVDFTGTYDQAVQQITLTAGIASAEAFGTTTIGNKLVTNAGNIASAEAFGTHAVAGVAESFVNTNEFDYYSHGELYPYFSSYATSGMDYFQRGVSLKNISSEVAVPAPVTGLNYYAQII